MLFNPVLLAIVLALAAGAVLALLAAVKSLRRARHDREAAARLHRQVAANEDALIRRLRLAAHDIRGMGMTLHGHADHLAAEAHAAAAGIATGAADLLDLADDLQDLTIDPTAPRNLRDETLMLGAVVDEAIAAVAATILPGRRNWRIQPDLRQLGLTADRRALRHAITRVLADAVRNTRHDDWIDIGSQRLADGLAIVIADEGHGSLTPEAQSARQDSRGIGLRLALARSLVEAHGGRLEVEAYAGVGCRVSLVFPSGRLPAVSPRSRSYGAPAPAAGSAGQ